MVKNPVNKWPSIALIVVFCSAVLYFSFLQFNSRVFYDPDSYYNMAVTSSIKDNGLHHRFDWAQFSVFKTNFADKDLVLHLITLPFAYITANPVYAGKYALVLCAFLFLFVYTLILRKYASPGLTAIFLLFPLSSSVFSIYLLELRSVTLANILIILGVYSLIKKRTLWILIISAILPLTHVSFFLFAVFALICECLRRAIDKEFCLKNIYAAAGGILLGIFIHPNFPNNVLMAYLNSIVVGLYIIKGVDLGFSGELMPFNTKFALTDNFSLFFCLGIVLWTALLARKKAGFSSCAWLAVCGVYLAFAFFSSRYWYQANIFFFIFCASYAKDLREEGDPAVIRRKTRGFIALGLACLLVFIPLNTGHLFQLRKYLSQNSAYRENTGRWMSEHMPGKQTVYHSYWDDSAYFMCLNPKDNYINTLDPIYMFYGFPKEFDILNNLSLGRVNNPREVLEKVFKVKYGYLRKSEPLYRQVLQDRINFSIIYADAAGAVFEIRTSQ